MKIKLKNKYDFNHDFTGSNRYKVFSRLSRIYRDFSTVDVLFDSGAVAGVELVFRYTLLAGFPDVVYKYRVFYRGFPVRSDFVRWLFKIGLSPCDCQSIADSVDFD